VDFSIGIMGIFASAVTGRIFLEEKSYQAAVPAGYSNSGFAPGLTGRPDFRSLLFRAIALGTGPIGRALNPLFGCHASDNGWDDGGNDIGDDEAGDISGEGRDGDCGDPDEQFVG
jgi:hypothetical protein